jgi:hypothetical protein
MNVINEYSKIRYIVPSKESDWANGPTTGEGWMDRHQTTE